MLSLRIQLIAREWNPNKYMLILLWILKKKNFAELTLRYESIGTINYSKSSSNIDLIRLNLQS